jgi:DNA-binding beta-propeller fold protein YncE
MAVTVSGQWTELLMTVYDSSTQLPTLHRVGGDPAVWVQQKADQSTLSIMTQTFRTVQQPTAMAISYQTNDIFYINSNNGAVTLFDTNTNTLYTGYSSASISVCTLRFVIKRIELHLNILVKN